jgi:hypothetical protein
MESEYITRLGWHFVREIQSITGITICETG